MLRFKGYARCFFSVAGLLRSKLRQAGYGEETAFVPQACITARKTMKTGWRGPCPYKPIKPIRLTCPLRAADLTGSEHPMRQPVFKVWGDNLFSWFSFVSATSSGKGLWALTLIQRVFLVLVLKTKMPWICRVRRYFRVHHIEHPIKRPTNPKATLYPSQKGRGRPNRPQGMATKTRSRLLGPCR